MTNNLDRSPLRMLHDANPIVTLTHTLTNKQLAD